MSYNQIGYRNADGVIVTQGQAAATQGTSVSTTVVCSAYSGVITTFAQTAAAGAEVEFTVTNTVVAATDVVVACIKTHTSAGDFIVGVSAVANGSFKLRLTNLHASTAGNGVLVINFIVLKAVA
jgi:hypothetical protein